MWIYDKLPPRKKTVRSKQGFKTKYNTNRLVARFKARLIVKGFLQVQNIDFFETFLPIIRKALLYIYLTIYIISNLFIHQVDIVKTYLKSQLDDNKFFIFIQLLLGMYELCQIQEKLMCRLLKSLYGLKQLEKLWNQNVITFYKRISFTPLNRNSSILIWQSKNETSIISVYIDNFFLISNIISYLDTLKKPLANEYNIKDLSKVKTLRIG